MSDAKRLANSESAQPADFSAARRDFSQDRATGSLQ